MKKISIILISLLIIFMIFSECTTVNAGLWSDISQQAKNWIKQGDNNLVNDNEVSKIVIPVIQLMVAGASIVVTVATVVMGIKYMVANPEGKAKLKQQLIGLVVSTIVIWGAQGIWALIVTFLESIT